MPTATPAPVEMSTFLGDIGTFFSTSIDWLATVLNTVVTNPPLLVLCIAMPVCGFAVGLLSRLLRVG